MPSRFLLRSLALLLLIPVLGVSAVAQQAPDRGELEQTLGRLAQAAQGSVGVGAVHVESGRTAWLAPDEAFPMASTYKLPIAIQLLHRVQHGEIDMSGEVAIGRGDLHPGSGTLAQEFEGAQIKRSREWLLERMLIISDNSATDLLLREAGGAGQVTSRMRALDLPGIRVDRSTLRLIADWLGVEQLPPERQVDPDTFRELYRSVTPRQRNEAADAFDLDPQDTATPRAMTALLARLQRRELLTPRLCELLLGVMRRCETGPQRIVGQLPTDTVVAHKTGTIGRTTNDVGILRLPDGAGHVALSVFVKQSQVTIPERERVIASIARAVYDHFLRHRTGS